MPDAEKLKFLGWTEERAWQSLQNLYHVPEREIVESGMWEPPNKNDSSAILKDIERCQRIRAGLNRASFLQIVGKAASHRMVAKGKERDEG